MMDDESLSDVIIFGVPRIRKTFCNHRSYNLWSPLKLGTKRYDVNLRPAGGGVFEHPPLRFFADSKKTAARSAAGFSPTLSPIFLATFVKVSILGHARSGHQVRSSDHTLQKLHNRAPATVFEGKL